jgi:hypothetical protein
MTPVNNLLSVSTEVEHPNFVNPPKGEGEARERSGPLLTNGTQRVTLQTRWLCEPLPPVEDERWRARGQARSTAPSGMIPASRYRQNAINSFRAKATMPILRMRLLPCPNFV